MVELSVEGTIYTLDTILKHIPSTNISIHPHGQPDCSRGPVRSCAALAQGLKEAHVPLLVHVGTMFTTAMIFLGLAFSFSDTPSTVRVVDGWYVTMAVEATVILLVSGRTSFLNFRRTNIIERLGLLTLIILGEGIMSLGEQASTRSIPPTGISAAMSLVCSCVVFCWPYFIYFLYFDQTETKEENGWALFGSSSGPLAIFRCMCAFS